MTSPEVDLVYADLQDAFNQLEIARSSPKEVRRCFSRFVELSQRLTSAMRKDFKALTGCDWRANGFDSWDAVTDLFKVLRNNEQHELQTHVTVLDTSYYKIFDDSDQLLAVSGTWETIDQLLDAPPDDLKIRVADPKTGAMTDKTLHKVRAEYQFLIKTREERTQTALERAGAANIHELSRKCMITLSRYYEFYLESLHRLPVIQKH